VTREAVARAVRAAPQDRRRAADRVIDTAACVEPSASRASALTFAPAAIRFNAETLNSRLPEIGGGEPMVRAGLVASLSRRQRRWRRALELGGEVRNAAQALGGLGVGLRGLVLARHGLLCINRP
jgi:hypothetical protein